MTNHEGAWGAEAGDESAEGFCRGNGSSGCGGAGGLGVPSASSGQALRLRESRGRFTSLRMTGLGGLEGKQIPPLRCGMTNKERCGMTNKERCGMTNKERCGMTNKERCG